jgi:two-component system, OmpR family, response regulator
VSAAAPRVLVAEDDAALQGLIALILAEDFDADVEAAHDGDATLAALASGHYALLILDLGLPGADGLEVLRWLTTSPTAARLPVIVCTAAGAVLGDEALALGAVAVLHKPFDLNEFLAAVRPYLHVPRDFPGPRVTTSG